MKKEDLYWKVMYELACNLNEINGSAYITTDIQLINPFGITEGDYICWLNEQEELIRTNNLNEEKINKLKELGLESRMTKRWLEVYIIAKNYVDTYGLEKLPTNFKTLDGITEDENGTNIVVWIKTQMRYLRKGLLNRTQTVLFEEIGIDSLFIDTPIKWLNKYEKVKQSIEEKDFETYKEWINVQIRKYNEGILNQIQIQKMKELFDLIEKLGYQKEIKKN